MRCVETQQARRASVLVRRESGRSAPCREGVVPLSQGGFGLIDGRTSPRKRHVVESASRRYVMPVDRSIADRRSGDFIEGMALRQAITSAAATTRSRFAGTGEPRRTSMIIVSAAMGGAIAARTAASRRPAPGGSDRWQPTMTFGLQLSGWVPVYTFSVKREWVPRSLRPY